MIQLEETTAWSGWHPKSQESRTYVAIAGVRARRNGLLLKTADGHTRVWVSEERARKILARDYPGEVVEGLKEAAE